MALHLFSNSWPLGVLAVIGSPLTCDINSVRTLSAAEDDDATLDRSTLSARLVYGEGERLTRRFTDRVGTLAIELFAYQQAHPSISTGNSASKLDLR